LNIFKLLAGKSQAINDQDLSLVQPEQTYQLSGYVGESYQKPFNPDDLYKKKGDYSLYEEMSKDDQIGVCLDLKNDLIIGCGWDIVASDKANEEMAVEVKKIIDENGDMSLDEQLEDFVNNLHKFGFAIAEKLFALNQENELYLKSLKTRHPATWELHTDDQGNISKYLQHAAIGDIEVDLKVLIHMINRQQYQNPYGVSDLRRAYDAWFTKKHVFKFYAIYLEKAASPIPIAKYDKSLPDDKVTDLHNILKRFQARTSAVIPKEIDVEWLQANGNGEAYIKGINLLNMFIGRSLFVPDLVGLQGSETAGGAYSLGEHQIKLFYKHIDKRRRYLERLVNKHIVEPIINWNYGLQESYPKFQLKEIETGKATDMAKTFVEAIRGKLYKPTPQEINHFRSLIKFPQQEEVEFFDEPMNPMGVGFGEKPDVEENEEKETGKEEIKEKEAKEESEKEAKEFAKVYKTPEGLYGKKVDFAMLKKQLDVGVAETLAETKPIVRKIIKDVFYQLENKNILGQNPNPEKIDSIKFKYLNELNKTIRQNLADHYKKSRSVAKAEIEGSKQFRTPMTESQYITDFLLTEVFQYVGDWEYNMKKSLRVRLMNAIRDGESMSKVLDDMGETLGGLSEVSIERFARTKFTEVMNRARLAEFEESEVVTAYQYSAIMDDRTSDICAGLHGTIWAKGTEPVPPMHFNCRSTLVPITVFEKYNVTKSIDGMSPEEFVDENKGDGFSFHSKKEEPKRIEITDPGVDIETKRLDDSTDVTEYSKDGKVFHKTTVTYSEDRKQVLSMKHQRIEPDAKV